MSNTDPAKNKDICHVNNIVNMCWTPLYANKHK